ncbi:hypothetical protein QBC43DRAFT_294033 [Cladorrhinum sp. PSN259]|nr:hypothetical protein QBC43DRAFT_294033 [Cladorrhinum sp. PSN259]
MEGPESAQDAYFGNAQFVSADTIVNLIKGQKTPESIAGIAELLIEDIVRENVEMNPTKSDGSVYRTVNVTGTTNQKAALMQITGEEKKDDAACTRCTRNLGPFKLCVTSTLAGSAACANCFYSGNGGKCSLRIRSDGVSARRDKSPGKRKQDDLEPHADLGEAVSTDGEYQHGATKRTTRSCRGRSVPARGETPRPSPAVSPAPVPDSPRAAHGRGSIVDSVEISNLRVEIAFHREWAINHTESADQTQKELVDLMDEWLNLNPEAAMDGNLQIRGLQRRAKLYRDKAKMALMDAHRAQEALDRRLDEIIIRGQVSGI